MRALLSQLAAEAEHIRVLAQFGERLKLDESALEAAQAAVAVLLHPRDTKLLAARAQGAELLRAASQTEHALERSRALLSFLGVPDTDAADSLLALLDAFNALQQVNADVPRALRNAPAAIEVANLSALQKLASEASELKAQRARIDANMAVDDARDQILQRGEEYALALRRPKWFAWIFRSFWAARTLCARISKRRGTHALGVSGEDLAEALSTVLTKRGYSAASAGERRNPAPGWGAMKLRAASLSRDELGAESSKARVAARAFWRARREDAPPMIGVADRSASRPESDGPRRVLGRRGDLEIAVVRRLRSPAPCVPVVRPWTAVLQS